MSMSRENQRSRIESLVAELPALSHLFDRWVDLRVDWDGPVPIASPLDIAPMIDHTILKPTAMKTDVLKLCSEAAAWHFKSVCVNPWFVPTAVDALAGAGVLCCTVVGFPLGATTGASKAGETREAVDSGAEEVDMVLNQGLTLAGEWEAVTDDIYKVVEAARGKTVKVIIETCNLGRKEKIGACLCAALAGADFVKTSTGFGSGGATPEDVALMRLVVGGGMHVKASGGIRTTSDALSMISAGADRIGASASIAIVGA